MDPIEDHNNNFMLYFFPFFFFLERDPSAVGEPLLIKGYRERVREWIQESIEKKREIETGKRNRWDQGLRKSPRFNLVGEHLQRQLTYLKRKTKPLYAHPQAQAPLAGHNNNSTNNTNRNNW